MSLSCTSYSHFYCPPMVARPNPAYLTILSHFSFFCRYGDGAANQGQVRMWRGGVVGCCCCYPMTGLVVEPYSVTIASVSRSSSTSISQGQRHVKMIILTIFNVFLIRYGRVLTWPLCGRSSKCPTIGLFQLLLRFVLPEF